jgi:carbon storage regulator CsrA
MLVLGRGIGERIRLTISEGFEIWVEVVRIHGSDVRIGIEAPKEVAIEREEIIGQEAPSR